MPFDAVSFVACSAGMLLALAIAAAQIKNRVTANTATTVRCDGREARALHYEAQARVAAARGFDEAAENYDDLAAMARDGLLTIEAAK